MTIHSTAQATKPASHRPRPQKKTKPEPLLAQVAIDSEPAESRLDPTYYYFYVKHLNSNKGKWTILCEEWQKSWVIEQKQNNIQLVQGTHFHLVAIDVEDGTKERHVLSTNCLLEEDVFDEQDPPMAWAKPGNEVPVVAQPSPENNVVKGACGLISDWLAVRKKFEQYAGLQDFNDITWKATVTSYLNGL